MKSTQPEIDLNPHAWAEVSRILQHYAPGLEVWAFGSRAKWTAKAHSDLDLALITSEPLSLEKFASLKEAFDESVLPFRVDVVDWAATSDSFRKIIKRDKVVVQSEKDSWQITLGWKTIALEDALEALIDYRGKTPQKTDSGIPLVTAKVIKAGRIESPTEFIAPEDYDAWMRRGIPKEGDVVMTTEAPLGEVAQLGSDKVALAQRVITLRGKTDLLDNTYLLYLLQSEEMQEQLRARATGTTVLGIKQSELRKVTVRLPPISFQRNVAKILKTLDDRITLLRETNATLEAIAQALFKSWFVDFDPVRAKLEGRTPEGIDETTAALFPDGFEESELGLVPRGWCVSSMSQVCKISSGNRPGLRTDSANENAPIPLFGGAGIMGFTNEALFTVRKILTGRVGTLGKVHIAYPPFWASDNVLVLSPEDSRSFHYCFHWLNSIDVHALNRDSTQPLLTQKDLGKQRHVLPTDFALDAFAAIAEVIYGKIRSNEEQSQTLATLRDTLLPRLISGQLRLPHGSIAMSS